MLLTINWTTTLILANPVLFCNREGGGIPTAHPAATLQNPGQRSTESMKSTILWIQSHPLVTAGERQVINRVIVVPAQI